MTNDTNTLNGALKELGETLASNLTTQGVPSTWDEGLTTLVGKVLDIGPSPTPTVDSLTLAKTAGKQILSYADKTSGSGNTEYCTVTATALDSNNQGVSGQSVVFKVGTTTVATETTDSNGEASYTYTSQGSGDVVLSAECSSLIQTYGVQDCLYYDIQTVDKSRYTVTSGGANISYSSDGVTIAGSQATTCLVKNTALSLPTDYIAEVTITHKTGESDNTRYNYGGVCFDDCLIDFSSDKFTVYRFSNTSSLATVNYALQDNDVLKIEMDNGTMKIYINDDLKTTQSITNTGYYYNRTYKANNKTARSLTTKDLKIKPL